MKQKYDSVSSKANSKFNFLSAYPSLANNKDEVWIKAIENSVFFKQKKHAILYDGKVFSEQFFLLLEGSIRVYYTAIDGREITLYRVYPGDLCVLSINSLLNKHNFKVIAESDSDISALIISRPDFDQAMGESPAFRNYVLSTLNDRICDLMGLVEDTAFHNFSARLAAKLDYLFSSQHNSEINITHDALARELGTYREVVSRLLSDFQKKGCIKLSRGRIHLISNQQLRDLENMR